MNTTDSSHYHQNRGKVLPRIIVGSDHICNMGLSITMRENHVMGDLCGQNFDEPQTCHSTQKILEESSGNYGSDVPKTAHILTRSAHPASPQYQNDDSMLTFT